MAHLTFPNNIDPTVKPVNIPTILLKKLSWGGSISAGISSVTGIEIAGDISIPSIVLIKCSTVIVSVGSIKLGIS